MKTEIARKYSVKFPYINFMKILWNCFADGQTKRL